MKIFFEAECMRNEKGSCVTFIKLNRTKVFVQNLSKKKKKDIMASLEIAYNSKGVWSVARQVWKML